MLFTYRMVKNGNFSLDHFTWMLWTSDGYKGKCLDNFASKAGFSVSKKIDYIPIKFSPDW